MQRLAILGDLGERTILYDWTKQGKVWLASYRAMSLSLTRIVPFILRLCSSQWDTSKTIH